MSTVFFLMVAAVVIVVLAQFLPGQFRKRAEKKAQQAEWEAELEVDRARWAEERRQWNSRVQVARRHLNANDWRDPFGKANFVYELFGDSVPQYLWYEFSGLTAEETAECWAMFWPGSRPNFGDWEGHEMLRVRNAEVFLPEVRLSTGRVLPLEQIGHAQWWDAGEGFPVGCVRFSREGFLEKAAD